MPASFRGKTAAPASGFVLAGSATGIAAGVDWDVCPVCGKVPHVDGSLDTGWLGPPCCLMAKGLSTHCLRLRQLQFSPEAVFLCLEVGIELEKEGRNGYFRQRLLAKSAYNGARQRKMGG
ncbi:MAG: hypothetical protein H6573_31580 [Lewinellaceae bacterium]|nr:hypothetical protein [Lewinellaceae bacterium]